MSEVRCVAKSADILGEAEIGAWELGTGMGRHTIGYCEADGTVVYPMAPSAPAPTVEPAPQPLPQVRSHGAA